MYFNEKEDTNIDKELKKNKRFSLRNTNKKSLIIIIGIILSVIVISVIIYLIIKYVNRYSLVLNGSSDITIYEGTIYNEPGYEAYDNKKNNLNDEVEVKSNLDSNTIGSYVITYSLHGKTKTRNIKVVAKPDVITVIHLNGAKNLYLKVGASYNEPGYNAIDAIDGDLTNKVTINSNVDTSKRGTYRIIYSVVNSTGVTTTEIRTIIVQ